MTLPRTILVATDFSEQADAALAYAVELGARLDARIHLIHAVTIPAMGLPELGLAYAATTIEAETKAAQNALDKRVAMYGKHASLAQARLEVGDARDVIDRVAE